MQALRSREKTLQHEIKQLEERHRDLYYQISDKKRELYAAKQEIYALRDEQAKDLPLTKVFIFRDHGEAPIEYFTRNGHVFVDGAGKEYRRKELIYKYPRPTTWWVNGECFEDMLERLKKNWRPGQAFEPGRITVSSSGN